jgi:hypothetical protein
MTYERNTLAVRSVSGITRARLDHLKVYTRLSYGSLLDDAVEALWEDYEADGHDLKACIDTTEAA